MTLFVCAACEVICTCEHAKPLAITARSFFPGRTIALKSRGWRRIVDVYGLIRVVFERMTPSPLGPARTRSPPTWKPDGRELTEGPGAQGTPCDETGDVFSAPGPINEGNQLQHSGTTSHHASSEPSLYALVCWGFPAQPPRAGISQGTGIFVFVPAPRYACILAERLITRRVNRSGILAPGEPLGLRLYTDVHPYPRILTVSRFACPLL